MLFLTASASHETGAIASLQHDPQQILKQVPVSYEKVRAVPLGSKVAMARLVARAMERLRSRVARPRTTLLLINNSGGAMCCAGSRYPKPADLEAAGTAAGTAAGDVGTGVVAGGAGSLASPRSGSRSGLSSSSGLASVAPTGKLRKGRGRGKRSTVNAIANATFSANGRPLAANRYAAIQAMDRAANRTDEYIRELLRAKFVLSPPGVGYDCFRCSSVSLIEVNY